MNCWQILGITASSDKKTIKRAYASLLKKNRPDDDPEGFKVLHAAYQEALWYSRQAQYQYAPEEAYTHDDYVEDDIYRPTENSPAEAQLDIPVAPPSEFVVEILPAPVDINSSAEEPTGSYTEAILPAPTTPEVEPYQTVDYQAELARDWDRLEERIQALIRQPKRVDKVDEWRFLETLPALVDLEFRAEAGDWLFGMIAEANMISLEKNVLYIKPPVLNYLNNLFLWDRHWASLNRQHSDSLQAAIFPYLTANQQANKHSATPNQLYYYARIGAFACDLLAGFLPGFSSELFVDNSAPYSLGTTALYLLLVIPLMEASVWQASLGKRFLKLMVVNKQGLRISWYQSLWRAWLTALCIAGFKIVMWVNMYMSWRKNMLLQDYLSQSYVVNRD